MSFAHFIGVDVGTGSARAALVTENGRIIQSAVEPIQTWNPLPDFYEQSSVNIWNAVVTCIRRVVKGVPPHQVKGIGFDATCSLVVIDQWGNPLSVSPTGNNNQNVILWMDHRASKEAEVINKLNHRVLKYVGGKISLEMETPKLLWLKNNLPNTYDGAKFFFDLPDFLTWKATNCDSRSLCSLVCKWTYEITETSRGWNCDYFEQAGIGDLSQDSWARIGRVVLAPGSPVGSGLSAGAARELGLPVGTPVGASIIDAHAGGLGLVGCAAPGADPAFGARLGLICGTSTCHMAVSTAPVFAAGVWGPYFSAMVPGMWLNEGGQSATGKLVDHVIETHPATVLIKNKIGGMHIQQYLARLLTNLAKSKELPNVAFLTENLHIWPDFHGNRSPIADPNLKGMICGLTLNQDEENLAITYLATIQALAYGTKHILETLSRSGFSTIKSVLICGGLSKNRIFIQTQADAVNLPVICPNETESVLLGSAILGASAAQYFKDLPGALQAMGGTGNIVEPNPDAVEYHRKKYNVFLKMVQHQIEYNNIMRQ